MTHRFRDARRGKTVPRRIGASERAEYRRKLEAMTQTDRARLSRGDTDDANDIDTDRDQEV